MTHRVNPVADVTHTVETSIKIRDTSVFHLIRVMSNAVRSRFVGQARILA